MEEVFLELLRLNRTSTAVFVDDSLIVFIGMTHNLGLKLPYINYHLPTARSIRTF